MTGWKRWALTISLAFNLATACGLIYGAYFERSPASANDLGLAPIWRRLEMNAAQKAEFQRSNTEIVQNIVASRTRLRRQWLEGVELLRAPKIDWEAVRAKEAELDGTNRDFQQVLFSVWTSRARMLNPAQREQLFAALEEQMKSGRFFAWHPPEPAAAKGARKGEGK